MKYVALLLVMLSSAVYAEDYMVWYFTPDVRVVLSQKPCPNNQGLHVVAQKSDGGFIQGCWKKLNEEDIKIVWRQNPDDYAILKLKSFKPTKE
jgi:hypothetical protein